MARIYVPHSAKDLRREYFSNNYYGPHVIGQANSLVRAVIERCIDLLKEPSNQVYTAEDAGAVIGFKQKKVQVLEELLKGLDD